VPLRQAQTVTPEAAGNISGKLRRRNALIEKDLGHAQMSGDVVGGQASISHLFRETSVSMDSRQGTGPGGISFKQIRLRLLA
jgi:hypothetical protein